jgi:PTH1 family peptidyl-tRNA hydrolase
MAWIIVGLGNPDSAYRNTRHNAGRDFVRALAAAHRFPPFAARPRAHAQVSIGEIAGVPVTLVLPEVAMNDSGRAVGPLISGSSTAATLIVVRDDLDQPIGAVKLTRPGRGSGGQRGIESIAARLKTKGFWQLKLGISPRGPDGTIKKHPKGEAVVAHVLGRYAPEESERLAAATSRGIALVEQCIADAATEVAEG